MANWTEEEDIALVDGVRAGTPVADIPLPRHPESSRYQRLKKLHLDTKGNSTAKRVDCRRVVWSQAEIDSLGTQLKTGITPHNVELPSKTRDAVEQYLRWRLVRFRSLKRQIARGRTFAELSIPGKSTCQIQIKLYAMGIDPSTLGPQQIDPLRRTNWSRADVASLRAQIDIGLDITAVRIAQRTSNAIKVKARQLHLIDTSTWSRSELAELKRQLRAGVQINDVQIETRSDRKRRSRFSIRAQATRLGLIGDGIARKPWTKQETDLLILASKRGMSPSKLLGVLKKSADSVAQMKRRLKKAGRI